MNIKIGNIPNNGTYTSLRLEDCIGTVTLTDVGGVSTSMIVDGVSATGEGVFLLKGEAGVDLTAAEKATLRDELTNEVKRISKLSGTPRENLGVLYFSNLTEVTLITT